MGVILGLDPGLANNGWGVIKTNSNKMSYVSSGVITTKADTDIELRIGYIYDELQAIIDKFCPDCMSVEDLFFVKNAKSVMQVSQVKGVIILLAYKNKIPLREFSPIVVKRSVVGGAGRASKEQIDLMVKLLLGINGEFKADHESDALALAITYFNNNIIR